MRIEPDEGVTKTSSPPDGLLSFDDVFNVHHTVIYRYAYALLHDRGLAEDVTQEVFLRFHHHSDSIKQNDTIRAWLLRVTINVIRNQLRGRKRAEARDHEYIAQNINASSIESPDLEHSRSEQITAVRNALNKMKEPMRSCLILKHEGLSYRDISNALGIKESSIGSLVMRGRREFKRIFESMRCD